MNGPVVEVRTAALFARVPHYRLAVPIDDIPMTSDPQLGGGVAEPPVAW
ncbi:hypothetical protein L6E12_05730 [Actinokineospora sp. PR83]|nr:hypothetical protein [Actinokineospora sp. PR83]MCG8915291.1 hypothetical protein [Actinokineospora sp. PR83]